MLRRAVVFTAHGTPSRVARVVTFPRLPPPPPNSLNLRFLLSPVNPSDINVIEGVYPTKPLARSDITSHGPGSKLDPCYIVGNEGVAVVDTVGQGVKSFKRGDKVIMLKQQAGTWSSSENVKESDIMKLPNGSNVGDVQAATISVNPPTAYNMLKRFVRLEPGDWVVQNGANSGVGQAVIQIAAHWGLRTLNFIRDRPDVETLKTHLLGLGATKVFTLEDLQDKEKFREIKSSLQNSSVRLGLNCVSGSSVAPLTSLLGKDSHLITYGAMSKKPLALPSSAFIFKNMTAHGFMQGRWYRENSLESREELMRELTSMMMEGKLKEPLHTIMKIPCTLADAEATSALRAELEKVISAKGMAGGKLLLKFDD